MATKSAKAKSTVNSAGVYTKPALRKAIYKRILAGSKAGNPGQNSGRKMQMVAVEYKAKGGRYKK